MYPNNFELNYKIEKNKFILSIETDLDNAEYAFYLYKDGKRINIRWYSDKNEAEFILTKSGDYKGVGFVRQDGEVFMKSTPKTNYTFVENKLTTISIFGSCTSRDIFEAEKEKTFKIGAYIARQSIISALAEPMDFNVSDIKLSSKFQREQVINDLKKNTFNALKSSKSKYLIIDLIDERFNLAKYKNSIVTLSNEMVQSKVLGEKFEPDKIRRIKNWKILKNKKQFLGESYIFNNVLVENYIKEFCDKILSIFEEENIIIHKALMVDKYIDKNGKKQIFPKNYLKNNNVVNKKLIYMYDFLEKFMPKAKIIDESLNYCADENHKWGLAPMHYQKEYYELIYELLNKQVVK